MSEQLPLLLPHPRQINLTGDTLTLAPTGTIIAAANLRFEAQTLQETLHAAGLNWHTAAASSGDEPRITFAETSALPNAEGYRLLIRADGITITGTHTGIFYGVCTLKQLIMQYGTVLPCLFVNDAPDFPARGVMLDCSRDKVPTMETLYGLIDTLALLKINQVQLYMEHTFAYQQHKEVWEFATPFTGEEILALDAYCHQRHVDLVPNQNSLGHMERWLKFPRYNTLAECPDGFQPAWGGDWRSASTLDPLDPGSIELIRGLYAELLPHFSSKFFNVGCDEPWELGKGKSKPEVDLRGGRVYLDYLLKLHKLVTPYGLQMQYWGDIIIHYPDLIPELPKDGFAMEWGYESTHDFEGHSALFANSGIPFYVCPGTSSWNTIAGRTDNAIGNIRVSIEAGLKNGAVGVLNTDWGDNGHFQPLPVSYAAFAYGAGASWCLATNQDIDLPPRLDLFVFRDKAGIMGKLAYDLGNVYHLIGPEHSNSQAMASALQMTQEQIQLYLDRIPSMDEKYRFNSTREAVEAALAQIDAVMQPADKSIMQRSDANLIIAEFKQAANLLKHGASWIQIAAEEGGKAPAAMKAELEQLIERQKANWLARNRPGGLSDSVARFDKLLGEYDRLKK